MKTNAFRLAVIQARKKREVTENDLAGIMIWLALAHQLDVWAESMKSPDFPHVKMAVNRLKMATKDFNRLWELHLQSNQSDGFSYENFWDLTAQLSETVKAFTVDPKRMHSMAVRVNKETPKELEN